nr:WecB/TagA/CpsF family glycosyltransferase [Azospirillum sp. SYSU D00513]
MQQAVGRIASWIGKRASTYVCVTSVHGIILCQDDANLRDIHNDAGMVTTDGMPLVWLSRRAGHATAERVYGPDFMLEVCSASREQGWRHFFYGGTDDVLLKLRNNLESAFPGLVIADAYAPPFRSLSEAEDEAVVERINAAKPDIVWVGLGAPKQERWMAAHLGRLKAPVMIGVGAAFDFHAGVKPQAPRWMQRNGLEWLFRMVTEPRRLAGRYLRCNTLFLWYLAQQRLGWRRFPITENAVCGKAGT